MMRGIVGVLSIMLLVGTVLSSPVTAQVQNRGLLIAPLRTEMEIAAGSTKQGQFTVGNYTDAPMQIVLSTKQFSVSGVEYHYTFKDIRQDIKSSWVRIETATLELQPKEERNITYEVVIPADTPPGGQYFSIQASTASKKGSLPVTLEAVTLLYLKVAGNISHDSAMTSSVVPSFVIDRRLPYTFDVKNAGNVHFTGHFYAEVGDATSAAEHIVLPDTTRRINGTVTLPAWPGIYDVTYGYDADYGDTAVMTARVVFVPPWCIAVGIITGIGAVWLIERHLRRGRR